MSNKAKNKMEQKSQPTNNQGDPSKKVVQQNIVTVDSVYQTFPPKQKLATVANMLAWCGGQLMDLAQSEIPVVTMSQEVPTEHTEA